MANPKVPSSTTPPAPAAPASEAPPPSGASAPQGGESVPEGVQEAPTGVVGSPPDEELAEKLGPPVETIRGPYAPPVRPSAKNRYEATVAVEGKLKEAFGYALDRRPFERHGSPTIAGTAYFDPETGRCRNINWDPGTNVSDEIKEAIARQARTILFPSYEGMRIEYETLTEGEGGRMKIAKPIEVPFNFIYSK